MTYQGKPGKRIMTVEELDELSYNRKSVAIMTTIILGEGRHTVRFIGVTPAIFYLNRPASCILRDLRRGCIYEYIKPEPKPRTGTIKRYRRTKGLKEGIRRTLSAMSEDKSISESCLLMEILYGLDPVLADEVAMEVEKWLPDTNKVKAKLIEMEQNK